MIANPFVALYENPVATLTAAAYALCLVAALVATWWAAGRNALYLSDQYQNGWKYLVPLWYTVRVIGMLVIAAVDLLLCAGIVYLLT